MRPVTETTAEQIVAEYLNDHTLVWARFNNDPHFHDQVHLLTYTLARTIEALDTEGVDPTTGRRIIRTVTAAMLDNTTPTITPVVPLAEADL